MPGEREVLRLRPTLLASPGMHLAGLGLAAWALVLVALYASEGWHSEVVWWQPWTWFVGNDLAAHLWAAVVPLGVGLGLGLLGGRTAALLIAIGCVSGAALFTLLLGRPGTEGLPIGVGLAALNLVLFAELRRRSRHLSLTTHRLVSWQTFPRRAEWVAHHADLVELELHQGSLGRLADVGTLVAVEAKGPGTKFPAVPRASQVHALAEALVRQATATPYLRESQNLDRQVADALAALQRR